MYDIVYNNFMQSSQFCLWTWPLQCRELIEHESPTKGVQAQLIRSCPLAYEGTLKSLCIYPS